MAAIAEVVDGEPVAECSEGELVLGAVGEREGVGRVVGVVGMLGVVDGDLGGDADAVVRPDAEVVR